LLETQGIDPALAQPVGLPNLTRIELHNPTDPYLPWKGSGKYTGFNKIEDGGTCGGSGLRIW